MTIETNYVSEQFVIDPGGVYNFTFDFIDLADVQLYEENADGGLTLVAPSNYVTATITDPPLHQGGTVTVDPGYTHPVTTVSVRVARATEVLQGIDYQALDAFPAETHELGLDRLTMIVQELRWQIVLLGGDTGGGGGSPAPGLFIPLTGTAVGAPVSGPIEWGAPAASGNYRWEHGVNFGPTNAMLLKTDDENSSISLQARDTIANGAVLRDFSFMPDGGFLMPALNAADHWSIGFADYFGLDVLAIGYLESGGAIGTKGTVILAGPTTAYLFGADEELLLPKHPAGGSNDFMAATKLYVDDAIGVGGGQVNTQTNQGGGIELGLIKDVLDLPLRTLATLDTNLTITVNGDLVEFDLLDIPTFNGLVVTTGIQTDSLAANDMGVINAPSIGTDVVNLDYLEANTGSTTHVLTSGVQSIAGEKTFSEKLEGEGGLYDSAVKTTEADRVLTNSGALNSYVSIGAANTITGQKTFSLVPKSTADAVAGDDLVRFSQALLAFAQSTTTVTGAGGCTGGGALSSNQVISLDGSVIRTSGNQSMSGTKTFTTHMDYTSHSGNPFDSDEVSTNQNVLDVHASDMTLKEDVRPTKYSINDIMLLGPVDFTWKKGAKWGGQNSAGHIAQEVEVVVPEAVHTGPDGMKYLDPLVMIGVLVKGMQDQQTVIDNLLERIEMIEQRLGE